MSTKINWTRLMMLLLLGTLATGCGNSDGLNVAGDNGFITGNDVVFGRVLLDSPPSGATAEITDFFGNSLGFSSATVDSSGNFRIPVNFALLPETFRVRVTPAPGSRWNLPIVANVTNYSSDKAVFCNILTTLVALYNDRRGGTPEEAMAWVKDTFQIPGDVDIGFGVDESSRSSFRHSTFLRQAADRDGVASYVSTLIESEAVSPQIITAIGVSLLADLATDGISAGFGFLSRALGLNIGNSPDLNDLAQELSEVQQQLTQLDGLVQADFNSLQNQIEAQIILDSYVTLTTSLEPVISEIEVQNEALANTVADTEITNAPFFPSAEVTQLLGNISAYDAQTSLELLSNTLLGRNQSIPLLGLYRQMVSFQTGADPSSVAEAEANPVWAANPALSNTLVFDPFERFFVYYTQNQVLALNLLVEDANLSQDVTTIEEARLTMTEFETAYGEEIQYLGAPLGSDSFLAYPQAVFLERQHLPVPSEPSVPIYYTTIQAQTYAYAPSSVKSTGTDPDTGSTTVTTDEAAPFLAQTTAFQAPSYADGWSLTTIDDLNFLRSLALKGSPDDPVAGLQSLGFIPPEDWDGTLWALSTGQGSDIGIDGVEISGSLPVTVYDFATGEHLSQAPSGDVSDFVASQRAYIQVQYQGFEPGRRYDQILASGARPTSPPSLKLTEDGSRVEATYGGEDVGQYCFWSSTNPSQLEVEGIGTVAGDLTWHPGAGNLSSQTISASWYGMDAGSGAGKVLTQTITVPVPSPSPSRELTSIVIKPSNLILLDISQNTPFKAIGYYDDRSIADLTSQVTWSLELPNGFEYPRLEATINGSIPGVLIFFTSVVTDPNFTVKATLDGVVGTTQVEAATQ